MAIHKRFVFTSAALLASIGLSLVAIVSAYMWRPAKEGTTVVNEVAQGTVGGVPVVATEGDRQINLSSAQKGGNTQVDWLCSKTMTGGSRESHHGAWKEIQGAIAYNAKAGKLKAIEAHFAADSFTADQGGLVNTVIFNEAWFDVKAYPTCDFVATTFEPVPDAKPGTPNVTIKGKLSINGVTGDTVFPAVVEFIGEGVRVSAQFEISRSQYKVDKRHTSIAGAAGGAITVVDDGVKITLQLTATPDAGLLLAELGTQIVALRNENEKLSGRIEALNKGLDAAAAMGDQIAKLQADLAKLKAAGGAGGAAPVKLADLPKSFVDVVPYAKAETPSDNVPFTMVLVPGDPAKGIEPFYMGETEVTWDMFRRWAYCEDLYQPKTDPKTKNVLPGERDPATELKGKLLRPTPCYGDCARGMGTENKPAVGMSRLNAEKFCEWLSKETGRIYRLPTEAEWDLAYELGGGDPADKDGAAIYAENAPMDSTLGIEPVVAEIKSKSPNKLGLYDMLGNVAEWVKTEGVVPQPVGKNSFIRGGSFKSSASELTGKARAESEQEVWNKTYPNTPKSLWWYKDRFDMGFRLVCEPVNLPKK